MKLRISLLVLSFVLFVSMACGGEAYPTPALPTTMPPSPVAQSPTATPTLTPSPTAPAVQTATPAPGSLEQRLDRLAEQLEQPREDLHIPGMAIAIVKDDEVIFARGFGLADLKNETPVTPETIFAIGSATKAFTVTLAGMLVDEGKMDWACIAQIKLIPRTM